MDENSIKIIVCGDSYCASGNSTIEDVSDRAHFSQILEQEVIAKNIHQLLIADPLCG